MSDRVLSWFLRCIGLCLIGCFAPAGWAFSTGAPVCEVNGLPVVQMSPSLASPPPTGWSLNFDTDYYLPGTPVIINVSNTDPLRRVRGVLIWAKLNAVAGGGRFELPDNNQFQYVPAAADCGEWAVTHVDADAKDQSTLVFAWYPPEQGSVILRAFVVEDCEGDCRSYQALTPITSLSSELLLQDSFETASDF